MPSVPSLLFFPYLSDGEPGYTSDGERQGKKKGVLLSTFCVARRKPGNLCVVLLLLLPFFFGSCSSFIHAPFPFPPFLLFFPMFLLSLIYGRENAPPPPPWRYLSHNTFFVTEAAGAAAAVAEATTAAAAAAEIMRQNLTLKLESHSLLRYRRRLRVQYNSPCEAVERETEVCNRTTINYRRSPDPAKKKKRKETASASMITFGLP